MIDIFPVPANNPCSQSAVLSPGIFTPAGSYGMKRKKCLLHGGVVGGIREGRVSSVGGTREGKVSSVVGAP